MGIRILFHKGTKSSDVFPRLTTTPVSFRIPVCPKETVVVFNGESVPFYSEHTVNTFTRSNMLLVH